MRPAWASPVDLDELASRLLTTGDRLGSGHVLDRQGRVGFTLIVDQSFDAQAVSRLGGEVVWAYPERGVALVRSTDRVFGDDVVAAGLAEAAYPEAAIVPDERVGSGLRDASADVVWADTYYPNGPDLYAENAQWWMYAVGAAEPVPSARTVSGWTPEWQLEHDGAGVTIANNDVGGPGLWHYPLDIRVDVAAPLWGVCELWGAPLDGEDCVFEDFGPIPAESLCEDLGLLLDNPTVLDGDTCSISDQSLADLYTVLYGWDYINWDEMSAWFRPRELSRDFVWYASVADVAADPTLGEPGGVIPLFASVDDYRAYYEGRYLAALMPTGIALLNEQLAFAGIELALTTDFAAALEDGTAGDYDTADARLPDPDRLDWVPYSYELLDPPFHRLGVAPAEGLNGYDEEGELRVIIDPNFGAVDLFGNIWSMHGTFTGSVMNARHQPGVVYGTIRGLAPGARFISYPGLTAWGMVLAFRRAGDDGALVVNNSWVGYDSFSHWANGRQQEPFSRALEAAAEDLAGTTLLVFAAGNEALDLNAFHSEFSLRSLVQALPGALVVGGTAGRDYDWRGEIPLWMPDAPDRPYDAYDQAYNLDRPMIGYHLGTAFYGTNFGSRIDLVAPAGSHYLAEECTGTEVECVTLLERNAYVGPAPYDETGEDGAPGAYNVGLHWGGLSGTSFASPLVVGAAAVVAQAYEETHGRLPDPDTLARLLTRSADDRVGPATDLTARLDWELYLAEDPDPYYTRTITVDKNGPDDWMGEGRLDVPGAVAEARR